MTIIAWDGKTLAADKRAVNNHRAFAVTKIHRVKRDGSLFGISGDFVRGLEMLAWYEGGADPEKLPAFQRSNEDYAPIILVKPSGVYAFEMGPVPLKVEEPFHAGGSGRDFALAAMHLGCDARRAVEVAITFCAGCGNGIDTLTLDA